MNRKTAPFVAFSAIFAATLPAMAEAPAAWPLVETESVSPAMPPVLPLREQAAIRDKWLKDRLDTLVQPLMREAGVDMWVLVAREYLDDPVMKTMLDARSFTARRTTILVFHDPGEGKPLERLTVSAVWAALDQP